MHYFRKTETRKRCRQVDVNQFENGRKESFDQRVDLIERREAHLNVKLCELRLAIRAKVFVTKTVRNLEVFVETADHAQLLEELWRLRQRKKLSRLNTRRHDIVARTFRRRFDENRCFNLGETLRRHVAPDFVDHAMTQMKICL